MNILITGGAGFIGLVNKKNFVLIEYDISNTLYTVEDLDWVLHFASIASPKDYLAYPIKTLKSGLLGTHNCLGIAKEKKAKFVLASTSEIYGDPQIHPQREEYWGNVNPVGVRSCFSSDTELLTKDGWKFIKDIDEEDAILTLNKNSDLEYQKSTEVIKERYIGDMICFNNSKIDLLVTPNHNMYVRERGAKEFRMVRSFEGINWSRAEMLVGGVEWEGEDKDYFYLPKVKNSKAGNIEKIKMDDWLEFMGYYVTEGCTYIRKFKENKKGKTYDRIGYNVLIVQDKEKNKSSFAKIKNCLDRLPFKYYFSGHQFLIPNKQLALYFKQFGRGKDKFIPEELKSLSKRQLKILFNALMLGDGNRKETDFYSSSPRLIGDFQQILLKLGMAGNINVKDTRKKNPVYCIHILHDRKKDFLTPLYPRRRIKKYNGYVYCVTVPNHVIYVRRKGKCAFCGNCYDESKRGAEALTYAYHNQHNLDVRVARIFNTYGPNMQEDDGRVVSNFIVQALKGKDLTVYGDGKQTRSFCYVDDLLEGIIKLMKADFQSPVNLGNPNEVKIIDLAELILKLTNSSSKIKFMPLPEDDPKRRNPDIAKARKILAWEPKVSLDEGLKKTIDYFKKRLNIEKGG